MVSSSVNDISQVLAWFDLGNNHHHQRKKFKMASTAFALLLLFALTILLLPSPAYSGKTAKRKRPPPPPTPRLRQRTSAASTPTVNQDWYTRSYEDWKACSSEVLQLVAMENNIILPPRADRALILYNHFQNTAPPPTIPQPLILPPALPISIPLSSIQSSRPAAQQQPVTTSNRFQCLVDTSDNIASSATRSIFDASSQPSLLPLFSFAPATPLLLLHLLMDHLCYDHLHCYNHLRHYNHLRCCNHLLCYNHLLC